MNKNKIKTPAKTVKIPKWFVEEMTEEETFHATQAVDKYDKKELIKWFVDRIVFHEVRAWELENKGNKDYES